MNNLLITNHDSTSTVYSTDSTLRNPLQMIAMMFRDLLAGRELAWQLAVRDIRAQYRQTVLGIFWAFILPLIQSLTWIFLSKAKIVSVGTTSLPYPVYVFSGTIIWAILIDATNAPLQQTIKAKAMLAKINFPREAILVSGIYQTLFNAAIKIVLLLAVLIFFGIYPGWSLIWFPIGILSLILAGTTFGLVLTPVGMLYTDIGRSLPLLMQFLMYFSPVVFPMPAEGFGAMIFKLNPMTPLILTTRDWLTGTAPQYLGYFFGINGVLFVLLLLVWIVYRLAMPIIIERISA